MGVSDGGGGGRSIGALRGQIAAAAAMAELLHDGWRETGQHGCRRWIGESPFFRPDSDWVEVDTLAGVVVSHSTGPVGRTAVDALADSARAVLQKWSEAVDTVFADWLELPSHHTPAAQLAWAVGEINIDPTDPTNVVDRLSAVNDRLAGDLVRITMGAAELSGEYADAFSAYYASALPTVVASQASLLAALAAACRAQGEVWRFAADDLSVIEAQALAAMRSAGPSGGPDSGVVVTLTVVAAVTTALAAVPTLGGSTAVFGVISGAAAIAAVGEGARESDLSFRHLPLGAGHPDEVLANLGEALADLNTQIRTQEEMIRELMSSGLAFADDGAAELTPPTLDALDPDRVFGRHREVSVDPSMIAQITELWLPSVAGDLRSAEKRLTVLASDGFRRNGTVGLAPLGAWVEFAALQTRTSGLLLGLAGDLETAASRLEEAAALVGRADDDVFDRFRRIADLVERHDINDTDRLRELL